MMVATTKNIGRRALLKGMGASLAGAAILLKNPLDLWAMQEVSLHTQTRVMLGTFVTITLNHESKTLAEQAMGLTFEKIKKLEAELTRHDSSAPLASLNASGKLQDAPLSLVHVIERALRVHSLSDGAFDMTVAPLLNVYSKARNPRGQMSLDLQDVKEAKALVNADNVQVNNRQINLLQSGMSITLDGIAKGYIADMASEVLTQQGITHHLVNAGGDIRSSGLKNSKTPWRVGIENPLRDGSTITSINLFGAIATSGSYEMYYDAQRKYHHLINPKNKECPQQIVSTTVTAPTALEADALATALSVMPARAALQLIQSLPQRECILLTNQGKILASSGLAV